MKKILKVAVAASEQNFDKLKIENASASAITVKVKYYGKLVVDIHGEALFIDEKPRVVLSTGSKALLALDLKDATTLLEALNKQVAALRAVSE